MAVAAAILGTAILSLCFVRYSPVTSWKAISREQLAEKGRQVSAHFGLNASDWPFYEVATVFKPLARYESDHKLDVSPLSVRVTFVAKDKQAAEVGFDSGGRLNYWRPPGNYRPAQKFDSDMDAATAVFQFMAGFDAASYKSPVRTMGDEAHEENYTWKRTPSQNPEIRESIEVLVRDGVIRRAESKQLICSGPDDDSDEDYTRPYWDILEGVFGLICTVGVVAVLNIYLLWLVRRAISHAFPFRVAAAAFVVLIAGLIFGSAWERMKSVNLNEGLPVIGSVFLAGMALCFVAVGRGISENARPKWMSLEQLCWLAR